MPAKKSRPRLGSPRPRQRAVAAAVTILVLIIGSAMLAQVTRKNKARESSGEIAPASFSASSPSKEYVYAGARLVAVRERTVSPNGDDAAYGSVCVHNYGICWSPSNGFGLIGQAYLVDLTMKNTGSTTWTVGAGYKLGSQTPANNTTWGTSRVSLPANTSVAPGQQVTFTFSATKPLGDGQTSWNFQWQMVQETGVGFFGEKSANAVVNPGMWLPQGAPNDATFVSQSVPSFMFAGQSYPASITMRNTGSYTWTAAGSYKLGSQIPQDNTSWGANRVPLPSSIAPGGDAAFNFTAAAPQTPGLYNFQWMMVQDGAGAAGFFGNLSPPVAMAVTSKAAMGYLDYDLDAKTDLGIWRPATKQWLIDSNLNGSADFTYTFGSSTSDLPVPGDYNGDGKADLATIKSFTWRFDFDRNGTADQTVPFGTTGDIPVPQDYNGDKQTDIAIFRPSTGQWQLDTNRDGTTDLTINFGQNGDIPAPADFNGDGIADLVVFRPSTGQWLIDTNRDGTADLTITLGQNGDLPVAIDYNGDGRADVAVFRPSSGQWLIDTDRNGTADITVTFGQSGDIPVAGDYNGDGKADVAVFRPSTNKWLIDTNRDGTAEYTLTFAQSSDIPLRQNGWILKSMGLVSL